MRSYLKMHALDFENSNGLPTIEEREEDWLIANAPGWAMFLTPRYDDGVSAGENWIYNPVSETDSGPRAGEIVLGSFPNGARSLRSSGDDFFNFFQTAKINPNEWSFFAVFSHAPSPLPQYLVRPSSSDPEGERIGLMIGCTASDGENVLVYKSYESGTGNPVRLSHPFNLGARTAPTLMMVTFSTERGLAIFDGGGRVATAPGDTLPLNSDTDGDNNLIIMQNVRGDHGPYGILNSDLSRPENAGHRRAIEEFLMRKYGIPLGPQ